MSAALQQAEALLDVGRPAQAADLLARHLAAAPDDAYALCLLSRARLGTGDAAGALEVAGRAVALAPDTEWPHRLGSIALLHLGRVADAVRAAREAVRLEPDDWRTHVQLVQVLCAEPPAGQPREARPAVPRLEEAWQVALRAVSLGPLEPRTHAAVGAVAMAGAHYGQAEQAYRRVLQLDPGNAAALNDLALVEQARGRATTSVRGFAAAAADPRQPVAGHNVVVVGWQLARRLLLTLIVLSLLALVVVGDPDGTGGGLPPSAGVPVVLIAVAGLLAACAVVVARLPRSVRPVLRRAATRGWGLATTAGTALGSALLLAVPWPADGRLRGVLAALALLASFLTFVVARLGTQAHTTAYDRRHP